MSLAVAAFIDWQLRYDVDSRYYEVGVIEVRSGADGTASFRSCLPPTTRLSTVYTTGVYGVLLRATRPEAKSVTNCIRHRPNVRYVVQGEPPHDSSETTSGAYARPRGVPTRHG